jgi:hypothetical protein
MIAAGINTKALSTYMGHSSITITLDRYGHLLPGNETEAAQLLDTWLNNAAGETVTDARRLAQLPLVRRPGQVSDDPRDSGCKEDGLEAPQKERSP